MKISQIRESGTSNILRWAILNNAELTDNVPLISVINDELFYLVTIDGVNFYELLRLTQRYRNQIKICNINQAKIPSTDKLEELFPGFGDKAESVLSSFTGMVTQMISDNDIISEGAAPLFLPMLVMDFSVQIPFSFVDAVSSMSEEEAANLFTSDYPNTLSKIIDAGGSNSFYRTIMLTVERSTSTIRYESKYEQLLKLTKYFPLREYPSKLFKAGLLGFSKFDSISRGESRCSLFKPNTDEFSLSLRSIAKLKTPLEVDVAVQLPLHYMQILESSYFPEDLQISYRSSITNIIDNGLVFHNFNFKEGDTSQENAIDNYHVRISEANLKCLQLMKSIGASESDYHPSSLFSLLPPIYRANAVITFTTDNLPSFVRHSDPVIQELFMEIQKLVKMVETDIQRVQ